MKKLFTIALVIAMVFALAACGGGNTDSGGGDTTTESTSNNESAQTDDSTTTPTASQDTTAPSDNGSGYADPIENWPSFLPETTMAGVVAESDDSHFLITFYGSSRDEIKAYVEELKTAGFNLSEELTDESDYYSFSASNNSGWSIGVNHNSGGAGMYGNKE